MYTVVPFLGGGFGAQIVFYFIFGGGGEMSKFSQIFIFLSNRITFVKENEKKNLEYFGNILEYYFFRIQSSIFFMFLCFFFFFWGQTCAQAAKVLGLCLSIFMGRNKEGFMTFKVMPCLVD